jgi:RNA polymerase sigma-70 factor (ECF subfamily)
MPVSAPPAIRIQPHGERTVLRMALEQALQTLPDGMRQVLVLHDVEGYTHEEIANLLGVTAGTSKSQLFKARARMRRALEHNAAEDGEEVCNI